MSRRSPRTRVLSGHHTWTVAMVAKVAAGVAAKQETGSGQVLLSHQSSRQDLSALFLPLLPILTEIELFLWWYNHPLGVIFNPNIYVADFGSLSMKLIQESFQGMFFQQLYWEKSKQDTLWRQFGIFPKIHLIWRSHPSLSGFQPNSSVHMVCRWICQYYLLPISAISGKWIF